MKNYKKEKMKYMINYKINMYKKNKKLAKKKI